MSQLSLTISPTESKLHALELKEPIDIDLLDYLIKSDKLLTTFNNPTSKLFYENEKQQLIKYKALIKDGKANIIYNKAKQMKFGRVSPNKSLGLFSLRREIRHTLAREIFIDIDIENCHPVLLLQICKANGIKVKYLKRYVDNRAEVLDEIQTAFGCDREAAKKLFITLLYFGSVESWATNNGINLSDNDGLSFVDKFKDEIKTIGKLIESKNTELSKQIEKRKTEQNIKQFNKTGSVCSYFLQEYENQILETIYNYCVENGYIKNSVAVLCADGLMIEKQYYKPELLNVFNNIIKEKLGFDLKFTEKPLNQGYELDDLVVIPSDDDEFVEEINNGIGVFNDTEAAKVIYNHYKHWVCCNGELFVFDNQTGLWSSDEQTQFKIIHHFESKLNLLTINKKGDLVIGKKGYGNSTSLQRMMIPQLKMLCINNDWLRDSENTSLKKLLFLNGYLDLTTGVFNVGFKPDIVFMNRIQMNYDPSIIDNDYLNSIKTRLFNDPLGNEVGEFFLLSLARGVAGDVMKKIIFGLGSTNGGKSTATKACEYALGDYVGNFNAENLAYRNSSTDEAAKLRWVMLLRFKRLIFSNEIKSTVELNGNDIKKISSGGDALTARVHGGLETRFTPHFLSIVMANDIPKITPYDDAVNNRVNVVSFNKQFVDNPSNEYELKKDPKLDDEMKTIKFKQHFIFLLVKKYNEFQNGGRVEYIPQDVINAKSEWIGDESDFSIIGKFINEFDITNNPNDFVCSNIIQGWIEGLKAGVSIKKFSVELKKHCALKKLSLVESKNKKINGRVVKVWAGIKLKTEEDDKPSVLPDPDGLDNGI